MKKVGIDLGGTKTEIILLDEDNQVLERFRKPTERDLGYEHILKVIESLYFDIKKKLGEDKHTIGIGTPGVISPATGLLIQSNTTCLLGKPLDKDIEKILNHKIAFENDANCFALAEAISGAGKDIGFVYGVIMGTGCGGGLVINGQLRRGPYSGEWGHMVMNPNGPDCFCGFKGCIETYISGGGLQARYLKEHQVKKSMNTIIEEYRSGESIATKFIEEFLNDYGQAMANLINAVDPDIVILGGGLSNIDELYTLGEQSVKKHFFNPKRESHIVKNKLGDSAGVIGAAIIGSQDAC